MINFVKTIRKNLQSPTDPEKTYAMAQSRQTLTMEDLAEHIEDHGSNYDKGDVMAILSKVTGCLRELLLDGYIIQLGDLGTFSIRLKSNGVLESVVDRETGEKPVFTAADITEVRVKWLKSKKFLNMISDATFQEVETREARTAALKLKKEQLAAGTYDPSGKDTTGDEGHE